MTVYSYRSTMPGVVDTIEGIVITKGTPLVYSTDQVLLNKYVPGRLDRYVDNVLSNMDLVLPDVVTDQERADLSNTGAITISTTDSSTSMTAAQLAGTKALVSGGGVGSKLLINGSAGDLGSIVCKWDGLSGSANDATRAVRSTDSRTDASLLTSASPDRSARGVIQLQGNGATVQYWQEKITALDATTVRTLGVWARAPKRTDGVFATEIRVQFAPDLTGSPDFSGTYAQANFPVVADGKWRYHIIQATAVQAVQSGSTAAWIPGTGMSYAWIRVGIAAGAETGQRGNCPTGNFVQIGTIYKNPRGAKSACILRIDDGLSGFLTPLGTIFTTPFPSGFVGASGVTISAAAGAAMTPMQLIAAFGLKASHFVLTRHVGLPGFASWDDLRRYESEYGHVVGCQTHYNPVAFGNIGLRLLGPIGYNMCPPGTFTDVTGTIITWPASLVSGPSVSPTGTQGFPMSFYGAGLPATVVADSVYWARRVSTTTFSIHPTENAAANNVSAIDLTGATAATLGGRYGLSTNDGTRIAEDHTLMQQYVRANGLSGADYYAPNQSAIDIYVENSIRARKFIGVWGQGVPYETFQPAFAAGTHQLQSGALDNVTFGIRVAADAHTTLCGVGIDSDTEANIRNAVRAFVREGSVFNNVFHAMNVQGTQGLIWYMDEVAYWVKQGLCYCDTVNKVTAEINAVRLELGT